MPNSHAHLVVYPKLYTLASTIFLIVTLYLTILGLHEASAKSSASACGASSSASSGGPPAFEDYVHASILQAMFHDNAYFN